MSYAQYDVETGNISATVSVAVDPALLPPGKAQVEVPNYVDGAHFKINLETLAPELLPAAEE